jgi:tetratricopeptide (TPR) repeat protein
MTSTRGLLFVVVSLLVACGGGGAYVLRRAHCQRRAEAALAAGRQCRAEGRLGDALGAYAGYFTWTGGRRYDARVLAEYADLLGAQAVSNGYGQRDVVRAHTAFENAVRANPDDPGLRLKLAENLIRLRRFTDAREQLRVLQASAREAVDPFTLSLLMAKAFAGSGQDREAAEEAAKIVGFDLPARAFTAAPVARQAGAGGRTTEAYMLLAGLLRDEYEDASAADAVLGRCVEVHPEDATAWFAYAQRMAAVDDVAAAGAAAAQVIRLVPGTAQAAMADFLILNLRGQTAAATAAITDALQRFPDDPTIFGPAVRHAIKQREGGRALGLITEGLERFGPRPVLLTMIADVPVAPEDVAAVEEGLETLRARLGPAELRLAIVEARACMARRRWFEARRSLAAARPAVASDPRQKGRVDLDLARCHRELGEYDEQIAAASRVVRDDAGSLEAQLLLAQALIALGQTERAVAEGLQLDRLAAPTEPAPGAARNADRMARPMLDLWLAVFEAGSRGPDVLGRIERLLAAVSRSPLTSHDDKLLATAEVLSRTGGSQRAMAMIDESLADDPSRAALQAARARLALELEGQAAAAAAIDRAPAGVRADPGFLLVAARIGAAQDDPATAAGRLAAVEQSALACSDPPDAAAVLRELATLAAAGGRDGEAKRLWRLAIERLPDDLRGHLALVEIAAEEGDEEGARAAADEIGRLAGEKSPECRYATAAACTIAAGGNRPGASPRTGSEAGRRRPPRDPARLREARNLLVEAEGERRGWMPIQRLFAVIELREGHRAAAIARLEKALQMAPRDASVARLLDAVLSQSDRGGG